jgi:hypothetical protein
LVHARIHGKTELPVTATEPGCKFIEAIERFSLLVSKKDLKPFGANIDANGCELFQRNAWFRSISNCARRRRSGRPASASAQGNEYQEKRARDLSW